MRSKSCICINIREKALVYNTKSEKKTKKSTKDMKFSRN